MIKQIQMFRCNLNNPFYKCNILYTSLGKIKIYLLMFIFKFCFFCGFFWGYFLRIDCTVGFHGEDCNEKCGQCVDGMPCNVSSGVCPLGCKNYWVGPMCTGKYKYNDQYVYQQVK